MSHRCLLLGLLCLAAPHAAASPIEGAAIALRQESPARAEALLDAAEPVPDTHAVRYLRARAGLLRGEAAPAVEALREIVREEPTLFTPRFRLAEALLAAGSPGEALALVSSPPAWVADSELHHDVALVRGAAMAAAGDPLSAERHYQTVLSRWSPRLPTAELLYRMGLAQEQQRPGSGQRSLRRVAIAYPDSAFAARAEGRLDAPLSFDERRERALALYEAREYDQAIAALTPIAQARPDDALVHLRLGKLRGMVQRDDLEGALDHLRRALAGRLEGELVSEASWRLVSVLGALDRTEEALSQAQEHRRGRRGPGYRSSVDFRMARIHHQAGQWKKARAAFERHVRVHRPKDWTLYTWFVGWAAFRGGDYEQALLDFAPLTKERNLLVGPKALYWSAEAHRRLGRTRQAVALLERVLDRFPLCYYAVLTTRKLAALGAARALPGLDAVWPAPTDGMLWQPPAELRGEQKAQWQKMAWLARVGELPEARHLWESLSSALLRRLGKAGHARLESRVSAALDEPHEARWQAWRGRRSALEHLPTQANVETWRAIYPRAYRPYAEQAVALEPEVPELLLYSHMLQESRYKRFAISSAPAFGVMQFLLVTARKVANELKVPFSRNRLFDPAYNIRFGAYYLGALARRYGGQLPLAIAAYNGGPRLMDAHIARWGHLPFDEFIEEIDRHETRNYVRKVLDHYVRYVALYLPPAERQAALDRVFLDRVETRHGLDPNY